MKSTHCKSLIDAETSVFSLVYHICRDSDRLGVVIEGLFSDVVKLNRCYKAKRTAPYRVTPVFVNRQ